MAHNRKLVIGGVALTKVRLPARTHAAAMNKVRDDLEREIIDRAYLENAPFSWIGLIIRECLIDETEPRVGRIDKKDGELPVTIEIDTNRLVGASAEHIEAAYRSAAVLTLNHLARQFDLTTVFGAPPING